MGTIQELQALIDESRETTEPSDVVNIHLSAVIYAGDVTIGKRPVNPLGSAEREGRTVFTGSLCLTTGAVGWINEIQDVDFLGGGRDRRYCGRPGPYAELHLHRLEDRRAGPWLFLGKLALLRF